MLKQLADELVQMTSALVSGRSFTCIREQKKDAYHALEQCDGLIKTGPTGTNVNDVSVLLIRGTST